MNNNNHDRLSLNILKGLKNKGLTLSLRACRKGRFGIKTRAKNNSKAIILKPFLIKVVQANSAFKVDLKIDK